MQICPTSYRLASLSLISLVSSSPLNTKMTVMMTVKRIVIIQLHECNKRIRGEGVSLNNLQLIHEVPLDQSLLVNLGRPKNTQRIIIIGQTNLVIIH